MKPGRQPSSASLLRRWLPCPTAALLAILLSGCDSSFPPAPDPPLILPPLPGLQPGPPRAFDPRTLPAEPSLSEDFARILVPFRQAYEAQGRPRLMILVNREFAVPAPSQDVIAALSRIHRATRAAPAPAPGQPAPKPEETILTDEVVLRAPQAPRTSGPADDLAHRQLEAHFAQPFAKDALCDVVSADPAWARAQGDAARLEQQGTEGSKAAAQIVALSKFADVLIAIRVESRIVADTAVRSAHHVAMVGEAINLHDARVLALEEAVFAARQPATATASRQLVLRRDELHQASLILAEELMGTIAERWRGPTMFSVAIYDLVSETQMNHIVKHLQSIEGMRRVDVLGIDIVPQGGYCELRLEFAGTPQDLSRRLRDPVALPGFRLETIHRQYTALTLKVVTQ